MSWLTRLQEFSKITPALIGLTLLLSVTYETSYFYPISLRFLSYYEVQDFIRNAIVWIPALLLFKVAEVLFSGQLILMAQIRSGLAHQKDKRVTLGGFWRSIVSQWRFYLAILFGLFALLEFLDAAPHPGIVLTNGVLAIYFFALCIEGYMDAYADAVGTIQHEPRAIVYSLIFAIILATQWGARTGRSDLRKPETAWIEIKQSQTQDTQKLHCTVLRELASTLIAVCNGEVYAIKNNEIRTVRYELPSVKRKAD